MTDAPLSRMARLALVTLAAGVILAACGSSSSTSKTSSTAAGGGGARRTALVACLRKHGVTLPAGGGPLAVARRRAPREPAVPEDRAASSRPPSKPVARASQPELPAPASPVKES